MENIKKYIYTQVASKSLSTVQAAEMLRELLEVPTKKKEDVAVIGIACRLPKAANIQEYWNNLCEEVAAIGVFPESRRKDTDPFLESHEQNLDEPYQTQGYIDEIDKFDAPFFHLTRTEADSMDPNQRLMLQVIWESLEDAGISAEEIYGSNTGVFIGKAHMGEPMYKDFASEMDEHAFTGSVSSIISSRISYILNLKGISMVVDTACSSGLVSIHSACKAILDGDCNMAIAGGVSLSLMPSKDHAVAMLESQDNDLRVFEKNSNGTVWGEGAGALVLKSLSKAISDGDNIYAVIKGSATNNDGATNGKTAPNPEAQEELLAKAWELAAINPENLSYLEAHATGTALGDPIEFKGITRAFKRYTPKMQFCAIGAVKPNIGHLIAASGVASAIKVILALKHKKIPATIKFDRPSEYIDFSNSPIYINDKLSNWEANGKKRIAGVSSFGLSGTNCHMVFEEAPIREEINVQVDEIGILTISAKKEDLLKELVCNYRDFVMNTPGLCISDYCKTAILGRGHYNNRLMILFRGENDLKEKLCALSTYESLTEIKEKDVFYGEHRVVSSLNKMTHELDITEETSRALSKEAEKLIKMVDRDIQDERLLIKIGELYSKGATIQWRSLFIGEKFRKISIPGYPFEKKRYWIASNPPSRSTLSIDSNVIHPLLEKCIAKSIFQDIYSTQISSTKQWILDEHRIMDNGVLPGTAYIEMAFVVGRRYLGEEPIEIYDAIMHTPAFVNEGEMKEIQIIVKKGEGMIEIVVAGLKDEEGISKEEWLQYFTCSLKKAESMATDKIKLETLKNKFPEDERLLNPNELSRGYIKFGERWLGCCTYKGSIVEGLTQINMREDFIGDLKEYMLHPALLDMAVNPITFLLGENYLPLSYGSIKIYGPTPRNFYSYIKRSQENGETIEFDIVLCDHHGEVFVQMEGYTIKKALDLGKYLNNENLYSTRVWTKKKIESSSSNIKTVLIVNGSHLNLTEELQKVAKRVVQVSVEDQFRELSKDSWMVTGSEANFEELYTALGGEEISHVFFIPPVFRSEGDLDQLELCTQRGIYHFYNLAKTIIKNSLENEVELVVVSQNAFEVSNNEEWINPIGAAAITLGRTIHREHFNVKFRGIDIDTLTDGEIIIEEIMTENTCGISAYRKGLRFVEEISEITLDNEQSTSVDIKKDGVYIITGGTGEIGLEISKFIASKNSVNLILINRSAVADRKYWNDILEDGKDKKLTKIINSIRDIESTGTTVNCYSADVTNEQELGKVIADVRIQFGYIHGVIHSAGIAGNSFIEDVDMNTLESVLKPKIFGALLLDRLTKEDTLDFFIMFSSLAGVIGVPGQGDYSVANAFLDAYSYSRNIRTGKKTISINWPAWKEIGMAVQYNANIDTVMKAMTTEMGVRAFEKVLESNQTNIIVGEWNYSHFEIIEGLSLNLSSSIKKKIERAKNKINPDSRAFHSKISVRLTGSTDGEYTSLQRSVAEVWAHLLGYDEINIHDNFYELGGDSITAIKLVNAINNIFSTNINISEVFKYLTIAEFSEYLKHKKINEVGSENNVITKVETRESYPASLEQQRLFVLYQIYPDSTSYNLPGVFEINGDLNVPSLKGAFQQLIERHEALRTCFNIENGKLVQKILDHVDLKLNEVEASEEKVKTIINDFIRPFNLLEGPIFRVKLIRLKENRNLLVFDIHHIIADGTSIAIFIRDFLSFYGNTELPTLKLQYKDYSVHQHKRIESVEMKQLEEYWLNNLTGDIPVSNMPTDFKRPAIQSFEGDKVEFILDKEISLKIKKLSQENGATVYMFLLAAYNVLLSKYTKQDDIIVGSPVAGRENQDLENVMGMFVNTLPMRNRPSPDKTFTSFLSEIKKNVIHAFDNQGFRLEELIKKLNVERDTSRNPLFDMAFVFQNSNREIEITNFGMPKIEMNLEGLNIKTYEFAHHISQFDLTLESVEREEGINCCFVYCTQLYKAETIQRLGQHFVNILQQLLDNPHTRLEDVELITQDEKYKILYEFNNTEVEYRDNMTVNGIFEEQVQKTPNHVAVIFGDSTLTYEELNKKANQLARALRKEAVGKDSIVGIMLDRSLDMMIGIMAILKAGGAYMPINPDLPEERINFMLEDSNSKLLLTDKAISNGIITKHKVMNIHDEILYTEDDSNLEMVNVSADLAYVIYTSGSTGKPKGVMIEHTSVINRINWMQKMYPIHEEDVILQKTPFSFDVSVWELFWWSFNGAKVCFLEPGGEKYPDLIIDAVEKHNISTMHFVPSMLNIFLEYIEGTSDVKRLDKLKKVFVSGEALTLRQLQRFNHLLKKNNDTNLYNLYGPTEATVDVSYFNCSTGEEPELVPIGKPIDNIKLYILDNKNKLQSIGVPGELCISGVGVGRGYINRPELTHEKFVEDPFFEGNRMYRSGDLARWMPDGNIEYLGRIDHQVKIRGFRIELGEIEVAVVRYQGIKEAVVIDREDKNFNKYLCAYIVCDEELQMEELRKSLLSHLPDYMVPTYLVRIQAIPLSHNGKVDRKRLPIPMGNLEKDTSFLLPGTNMEEQVAAIWREVLNLEEISINDDFFKIGGDSIKAIQIAARLKKVGLKMNIQDLFLYSSISKLVDRLEPVLSESTFEDLEPISEEDLQVILKTTGMNEKDLSKIYSLTPLQEGMLFHSLIYINDGAYFDQFEIVVKGDVKVDLLEKSLNILVERYDVLRTVFIHEQLEIPKQVVLKDSKAEIFYKDISNLRHDECVNVIKEFKVNDIKRGFELSCEPGMRLSVFKTGADEFTLVWDFHHIIIDGWSEGVIWKDLCYIYDCLSKMKEFTLPEVAQYSDYVQWLGRKDKGVAEDYWKEYLEGYAQSAVIESYQNHSNSIDNNYIFEKLQFLFDKETTRKLVDIAEENAVTLNIVFQAAWSILLQRYNNINDVVFGAVVSGRTPEVDGIESITGLLLNTIPVRVKCDEFLPFSKLLSMMQDAAIHSQQHEYYPLYLIQNNTELKKNLFSHILIYQNFPLDFSRKGQKLGDLAVLDFNIIDQTSFDFNVTIIPEDELTIVFKYNANVYNKAEIENVFSHLENIIDRVIQDPLIEVQDIKIASNKDIENILDDFNEDLNEVYQ